MMPPDHFWDFMEDGDFDKFVEQESNVAAAATHYRDAWLSVIYDATGDFVKAKRAMELAELNGLFDPVDAITSNLIPDPNSASGFRVVNAPNR